MNLQELQYFASVAEHRHFGRAAKACYVSQPTLSGQIRKLERELGVTLLERTNRRVALTPAGERILEHVRRAIEEARLVRSVAESWRDQLASPLKVGIIPTLAPYLMPLVLGPLRAACPRMAVELWEDLTGALLERLRGQLLDCALIATEIQEKALTSISLFVEPFLAALPEGHRLARHSVVKEAELGPDLLVLSDGHCLAVQTLSACGGKRSPQGAFRAASLETLVNLVAAGHGATLVPELAAGTLRARGLALRPLAGGAARTIRLAARPSFPRPEALRAVERAVREAVAGCL